MKDDFYFIIVFKGLLPLNVYILSLTYPFYSNLNFLLKN